MRTAEAGTGQWSRRQARVRRLADDLGIQERTVKAHVSAIFDRFGARNRTQAGVLLSSLDVHDPLKINQGMESSQG